MRMIKITLMIITKSIKVIKTTLIMIIKAIKPIKIRTIKITTNASAVYTFQLTQR